MNQEKLREILAEVRDGGLDINQALSQLQWLPFDQLVDANVDSHRELRTGQPEVIYAEGKTPEQLQEILASMNRSSSDTLLTRLDSETAKFLEANTDRFVYYKSARVGICFVSDNLTPQKSDLGVVAIISAGTSDKPVADEAALTAWIMGATTEQIVDVGVAGLHRLQSAKGSLQRADCIVVVAGMEGALASVIGGLTDKPVIATPTSVGYGASFSGIAALLGMLNSCASGVTVVNIDNGYGAGAAAAKIARLSAGAQEALVAKETLDAEETLGSETKESPIAVD